MSTRRRAGSRTSAARSSGARRRSPRSAAGWRPTAARSANRGTRRASWSAGRRRRAPRRSGTPATSPTRPPGPGSPTTASARSTPAMSCSPAPGARAATRRDDVSEIRRLLDAIRGANDRRGYAETDLGRKEDALRQEQAATRPQAAPSACGRRTAAPGIAAGRPPTLRRWAGAAVAAAPDAGQARPQAPPGDAGAASPGRGACREDGEAARRRPAASSALAERARSTRRWTDREPAAARGCRRSTRRSRRTAGRRYHRARQPGHRTEGARGWPACAASATRSPPRRTTRRRPVTCAPPAGTAAPGAPLWQLVRFADEVGEERAAAIEGALYGAGLLTAWVHPDPALTSEAHRGRGSRRLPRRRRSAAADADARSPTCSSPRSRRTSRPSVIARVLRSVALTDDIAAASHAARRTAGGCRHRAGAVQLWRARRRAAQAGAGVHRGDQPGGPPARPARRAR